MRLAVLCGLCTPKLRVCLCTLTSVVPIDCLPPRMLLQSAGLLVWLQIVLLCLLLSLRATRVGVQGFETRLVAFQHLLWQSGLNRFFLVFGLFGNCMQAFCGCFLGVTIVIVCVQASWYGDVLCGCSLLRTTLFAQRACSYSRLWRCTASGSSKRTVPISARSCSASTTSKNCSPTTWGALFSS